MTTEGQVLEALQTVMDPELGMSVVDLGLIYEVKIEGARVGITMTLTAPGCPIREVMPRWIEEAVGRIPGVESVEVTLTWIRPGRRSESDRAPSGRRNETQATGLPFS